jgi:hypothetical protein
MAMAAIGLLALAGVRPAAAQDPVGPAANPVTGTWGHAETYRVCSLTLMADGSYSYNSWSLRGEVEETGTYSYAGDVLTLRPQQRHAGLRDLPRDETPDAAVITWMGKDKFQLRFQTGAVAGDTVQLSRQ